MRPHLLVTNDFPPKIGGIQSYLWELWRRLPSASTTVLTTPHAGAAAFDAVQPMRVERVVEPVLVPHPGLAARIDALADEVGAELVLLDPAVPLGVIGPRLLHPYGVVLHGAEVTIPGRLPGLRSVLAPVLRGAELVVAAGRYALDEAERCAGRRLPSVVVPPGVDTGRFVPADPATRVGLRRRFGYSDDEVVVASVNRLVPRKGMDRLVAAIAALGAEGVPVRGVIGGTGREAARLAALIRDLDAPVELLGRIPDDEVVARYQSADLMAMLCHDRWRGLEQEGFGIVFLEAAATGLPQVAGRSGGSAEAVEDGVSGLVVDADDPTDTLAALRKLAGDAGLRADLGTAARRRAVEEFDYDLLAARLATAIDSTPLNSTALNSTALNSTALNSTALNSTERR